METPQFLARVFVAALALAPAALAQTKKANDPRACPYCRGDDARLKAAGLVSHGGFVFGTADNTAQVDALLPECEIRWLETANFRIGFGLGAWKVRTEDKKRTVAELTRLKQFFPDVKPDTPILDPWLRTHLYAQRAEDQHVRFLALVQAQDLVFPTARATFNGEGAYMGEGPYLGQPRKYEFLVVPTISSSVAFLTEHCGIQSRKAQRWHYTQLGSIALICSAEDGYLRNDNALWGHLAFNLAHNLYDGFLHYSYDTPIWLHEGLAHLLERELSPKYNSFDSDEGAIAEETRKKDWRPEVLQLISSGDAPRMAELVGLVRFNELTLRHHYTTWSMLDFLNATRPKELAQFLCALKRNLGANGLPTGEGLPDVQRTRFKEIFGWNYAEFDAAWRAWCAVAYKPQPPKGSDPNIPSQPGHGTPPGGGSGGG
jgi:hypothetical protein